eukprot:ANDGO_05921.mRNA.1 Phospholipase B-like protein E
MARAFGLRTHRRGLGLGLVFACLCALRLDCALGDCFATNLRAFDMYVPATAMNLCLTPASNCSHISFVIEHDGKSKSGARRVHGEEAPSGFTQIASGTWTDCLNTTGWTQFSFTSLPNVPPRLQSLAAGYAEGVLAQEKIWSYARNAYTVVFGNKTAHFTYPAKLEAFLHEHYAYLEKQIADFATEDVSGYWAQIQLLNDQMEGLLEGYMSAAAVDQALTWMDFLILQLNGDLDQLIPVCAQDLELIKTKGSSRNGNLLSRKEAFERISVSRCSAIVKLTADFSELYTAHTTWGSYSVMLRTFKQYNFAFNGVASNKMALSSYPGVIASVDDFYAMPDSKLAVTETTNDILNDDLLDKITKDSVMYWMRVMVACRLASNTEEWTTTFAQSNSGTYNNQWIVVDYKLFTPGQSLAAGAVRILEQIPGDTASLDVTSYVVQGHWASYNRPFFPQFFEALGYPKYAATYGDIYSYAACPRAEIFRRDADSIASLHDTKKFIVYNNFKVDPLSSGYPGNSIAARFDLKGGPFDDSGLNWFYHGLHGGIDGKVVSNELMQDGSVHAISGPTHDDVPPFVWSAEWDWAPHEGLPSVYDFDWVHFKSDGSAEVLQHS